jgi:hypothetical protein
MAEVVVTAPQDPPVTDKNKGKPQASGLPTPGSTPEPETARNKADEERQRGESQNANAQQPKDKSGGDGGKSEEHTGGSKEQTNGHDKSAATGNAPTGDAPTGDAPTGDAPTGDAPTGGAATTGNEAPKNGDEMETEPTPRLERTKLHLEAYESFGEILGMLLDEPESTALTDKLDIINNSIREYNTKNGFSQDQFVIDYSAYILAFKEAAPYRATLATKPDKEAKGKLESINKRLEEHNKKHDYPSTWVIVIPEPPARQRKSGGRSTNSRNRTGPKALTINETDGYVFHGGKEKEIAGHVPAGFGHRLLLRQDGLNDYDIYELVRASKFGKNFMDRNKHVLEGKEMKVGTKKDLEGMNFNNVKIFGVAPVRTDSDDEAGLMVWLQFPRKQPLWYWRTWLGDKFGLDIVDTFLNRYRKDAGQRLRRSARSISLGEEDTTDEDGEAEDSEDDDGSDDEAKLAALVKEVEKLQIRLKKSGNKSSTSSRKSKSKRAN